MATLERAPLLRPFGQRHFRAMIVVRHGYGLPELNCGRVNSMVRRNTEYANRASNALTPKQTQIGGDLQQNLYKKGKFQ